MRLKNFLYVILFIGGIFNTSIYTASASDTIHVFTHKQCKVITDPSKGNNGYKSWGIFPSKDTPVRKVILSVTFQRPDSLRCGEWDYIDNVFIRRAGSVISPSKDFEIARLITPYGWFFEKGWKFNWEVDVTDFSSLLRDSVEIEYNHSGYEDNKDRAWIVTLDFKIIKGKPITEPISITKIYEGSFPYGDSLNDIEKLLKPFPFNADKKTHLARLRIVQTGHGMDEYQNCAEFCSKYREIIFDGKLTDKRYIWQKCGKNPLYPQAGTWIFDRANWCPGCMVKPETYDFYVEPESKHMLDINMEPYKVPKNPSANYHIYAYLVQYGKINASNDVSVEDIMVPSGKDIYKRLNPSAANPKIIIRNNGKAPLLKLTIKYGTIGFPLQTYTWNGMLLFNQTTEIELKGPVQMNPGINQFEVKLVKPNDKTDEYDKDNMMTSTFNSTPVIKNNLIFYFKTNNQPEQNFYYISDINGKKFAEHKAGSLKANTEYRDTLNLVPGYYELMVTDTAGDGLEFWFNTDGGRGIARLLDTSGIMIRNFDSDFGSEIYFGFMASGNTKPSVDTVTTVPAIGVFPTRTYGKTTLDYFNNKAMDVVIQITDEAGKIVEEHKYYNMKEGIFNYDLSNHPRGRYYIKVTCGNNTYSKRIRLTD